MKLTTTTAHAQCSNLNTLDQADTSAVIEAGDRYGDELAVGDFNGDGVDDLVIGSPSCYGAG